MKLNFIKTWEASGNGVFEPDMIVAKAYKIVFASYRPKHFLYFYKDNRKKLGEAYDEAEEMRKFGESGSKDFQNQRYLTKYFKGVDRVIRDNKKVCKKIDSLDIGLLSKSELQQALQKAIDSISLNYSYFLASQPQCFVQLEEMIKLRLLQRTTAQDVEDVFRLLSSSTKNTPIAREQIDWLNLILKIRNSHRLSNEELNDLISKHHKNYAIINASDGKDPWTINYFFQKFDDENRTVSELKRELKKIKNRGRVVRAKQKKVIEKWKIDKTTVDLCLLLAQVGHSRFLMRIDGWMPLYEKIKSLLRVLANKLNCNRELLRFLTVDELLGINKIGSKLKSTLRERRKCFLLVYKAGKTSILRLGSAEKKFLKFVPKEDFTEIKEIKGTIAMKGKVKGRVLLFQWGDNISEKISSITENQAAVLVTGQTRPQLVPLIAKCQAIVTDEGGIISHSAIVSRELGIPCIVGTRIGTRVFHDGEMVEVDAEKGIVRKI